MDWPEPGQMHAIAAIRYQKGDAVDAVLAEAASLLAARGLKTAGFVQREAPATGDCCATMLLEDLATGERSQISQSLGREARGCKLDPQALAQMAGRMLALLDADPDVLMVNRFGKSEAEGGGLRGVVETAVGRGVPVVLAVHPGHLEQFLEYAGDMAVFLPQDAAAIAAWAMQARMAA